MASKYEGASTKYYLTKDDGTNETVCQLDTYTGNIFWTTELSRGTAYEELETVNNLKNIQSMLSTFMGKTETFRVLKEDISIDETE